MTVPPINPNISDESEDMDSLPPEEDIYRRKYQLLLERCEVLQQDNERIVNRMHQVKKLSRRYRKDIILLKERLDQHGDAYAIAATEAEVQQNCVKVKKEKVLNKETGKVSIDKARNGSKKTKRKNAKGEKAEKDPNAPKKPCNAFFQFCQEQRPLIVAEVNPDPSSPEPTKQEVTKQLAFRWRGLSTEDKKVYVAMFERSKEKYAEEMSMYVKKEPIQPSHQ